MSRRRAQSGLAAHVVEASRPVVLIRGGGDLATGVAARLHRSGFAVVILEVPRPLAVRRLVALAEAVYVGQVEIEDLRGLVCLSAEAARAALVDGWIPVVVDPEAECRHLLQPAALVDARMRKAPPELGLEAAPFVVGLGPGFTAGVDCHAVVETQRGHHLGRVLWHGQAAADTGLPEPVAGFDRERILRAPASGRIEASRPLGALVRRGEEVARVGGAPLLAPFDGALRGLMHDGLEVAAGDKIGDLDPRAVPIYCFEISDKALAVGGGVLEALLSQPEIRRQLRG
ncbi:MAG: selenium-dependent molybdenum cofactor biosynthesis protein YqeB [Chloroflexota bacterium]